MPYDPNFLNIELKDSNVFVYSVRRSLHRALDKNLQEFKGVLLDLGCGEMPYKQYILDYNKSITKYIGVDIDFSKDHQAVKPDLYWDGKVIPMKDGSVDTLIATELFEHIGNVETVLKESYRVLKKDGILYFTVPFVWPLHETPFDEYRYTPYSLTRHLKNSKFENIRIEILGGYHAAIAQMLCIWISNVKLNLHSRYKQTLVYILQDIIIFPLIKYLINKDLKVNYGGYSENTMPTGYYGLIRK